MYSHYQLSDQEKLLTRVLGLAGSAFSATSTDEENLQEISR